jgi:DNA-binding response OmpR family regulator
LNGFQGKEGMSKTKVFIVDDDVTASRLLAVGLERTGAFEVRVENVATRALSSARQFRPDVVFMDVCMPGEDGTDVAFHFQNDAMLGATPLIFLTSLVSGQEGSSEGIERGGREFLPKPASLAKIVACIQRRVPHTESAGTPSTAI